MASTILSKLWNLLEGLWRMTPGPIMLRLLRDLVGYGLINRLPAMTDGILDRESPAWEKFKLDPTKVWELEVDTSTAKDIRMSCLAEFNVKAAKPLAEPLEELISRKIAVLSPYCYDIEKNAVLVVETQEGVELCKGKGFYYQSQHASATSRAYLVPVDQFVSAVNAACTDTTVLKRTALLHSTGRCGSTLLSRIMDAFSSTASLNEPDIYTNIVVSYSLDNSPANQAALGALLRAATLMLATSSLAFYPREKAAEMSVWFKFRSVCINTAGLMKKYMPETKSVYLYRNAVDYTDSACSGFMKMGFFPYFRMSGLDGFVAWKKPSHKYGGMDSPLMSAYVEKTIRGDPEAFNRVFGIGFVGRMGLMWQDNIWNAQTHLSEGVFDAVLRYEELIKYKEVLVLKMLAACGMGVKSKAAQAGEKESVDAALADDVDRVFKTDAHEGSQLKSSRVDAKGNRIKEPVYIKSWEMADMLTTLALHPTAGDPDIVLPGTLMA